VSNIDLSTFISETIISIVNGCKEANQSIDASMASVNPDLPGYDSSPINLPIQVIFDVAVTAIERGKGSTGFQVKVLGIGGDARASLEGESQAVTRIKFELPVQLPIGKNRGTFEHFGNKRH
jgi:hypothetical protein